MSLAANQVGYHGDKDAPSAASASPLTGNLATNSSGYEFPLAIRSPRFMMCLGFAYACAGCSPSKRVLHPARRMLPLSSSLIFLLRICLLVDLRRCGSCGASPMPASQATALGSADSRCRLQPAGLAQHSDTACSPAVSNTDAFSTSIYLPRLPAPLQLAAASLCVEVVRKARRPSHFHRA